MAIKFEVSGDCYDAFEEVKSEKLRFCAFGLDEKFENLLVQEKSDDKELTIEGMRDMLPKEEARYVYFVYKYNTPDGDREKTMLVTWIPKKTKIRPRMTYATGTNFVKQKLPPQISMDAELAEFTDEEMKEKCTRI